MTTGICKIDGIIIAIAIQVQAIDGFGVQVGGIVGADETAPLGGVIPGVAVVQAGVVIVVIAAVTDGICVCNGSISGAGSDGTISRTYILSNLLPSVKKKPPRP